MEGSAVSLEERQPEAATSATAGAVVAVPAAPVLAGAGAPRSPVAALPARISALARAQGAAPQLRPHLQYQIPRLRPAGPAGVVGAGAALGVAPRTLRSARLAP